MPTPSEALAVAVLWWRMTMIDAAAFAAIVAILCKGDRSESEKGDRKMSFSDFVEQVKTDIKTGKIRVSVRLSLLDMAVQYALGFLYQNHSQTITPETIVYTIKCLCGAEFDFDKAEQVFIN